MISTKKPRGIKTALATALLPLVSSLVPLSSYANSGTLAYYYCHAVHRPDPTNFDNSRTIVTSVFPYREKERFFNDRGMKNSLESFIGAELGGVAVMSYCWRFEGYQDAVDERNHQINMLRLGDEPVATVRWSYHGD